MPRWKATTQRRTALNEGISCLILLKKVHFFFAMGLGLFLASISSDAPADHTVIVNYNTNQPVKLFLNFSLPAAIRMRIKASRGPLAQTGVLIEWESRRTWARYFPR